MLSGPILLTLSYLSESFYQLVHTTDTASAASHKIHNLYAEKTGFNMT